MANSTGPGKADADAAERGSAAAGLLEEAVEGSFEPGQHDLGSGGDGDVLGVLGQDRTGEVGDRHARVGGADVARQHDPGVAVEGERGRRPATGGRPVRAGDEQAAGEQGVDPLCDRRPGQAGQRGEVAPGGRMAVADEVEDRARGAAAPGARAGAEAGSGPVRTAR